MWGDIEDLTRQAGNVHHHLTAGGTSLRVQYTSLPGYRPRQNSIPITEIILDEKTHLYCSSERKRMMTSWCEEESIIDAEVYIYDVALNNVRLTILISRSKIDC